MIEPLNKIYEQAGGDSERLRKLQQEQLDRCMKDQHSWCVVRDGTRVCNYCGTCGDAVEGREE